MFSLDVPFELIQVRTGIEGLKRLHRGGSPPVGICESVAAEAGDVLQRMKGSEGDRKRRNAEVVGDKLSRTPETGLRISRDSYATQRRIEDGLTLKECNSGFIFLSPSITSLSSFAKSH
jgi:hypothetical protein